MEELLGKKLAKLDLNFLERLSREACTDDTLYLLFEAEAEHNLRYPGETLLRFLFFNEGKVFVRSDTSKDIHIYENEQFAIPADTSQCILLLGADGAESRREEVEQLYDKLLKVLNRKRVEYRTMEQSAFSGRSRRLHVLRAASVRIGANTVL
ncbi:hypothetical protein [Saccharibacillus endophyticus]|uniref:AraC family transcriptional regulator n=1 Tax=Saccharibacillus endophyticus TaxID=2060666 RepID=A0ABQ1ZUX2_9BACL|nr:hypothetical protein [Saccharibacillus endophyticus]GGH77960.1 hypothetical protein GCM10007362_22500 [Saccharibacillus endophyticus]